MEKKSKNNVEKNLIDYCKTAALRISKKPVDEYEIYGFSASHNEIELYKKQVESLSFSDTKGIGFRIFKNKKMGYSYTSDFDESAIDDCITKAVENAEISDTDEFNYLPEPEEFIHNTGMVDRESLYSKNFDSFSTEDKIKTARDLEKIALKKDSRISSINNLIYDDISSQTLILNSRGLFDHYNTTSAFIYLSVISRNGPQDISTGDYFGYARDLSGFDIENVAENAVRRSVMLLGAKKIRSVTADLLLDPFVGAQFLQIISGVVSADSVQKGKSLFKDKIDKSIFSIDLNIYDDGTLKTGLASGPFDGEGVPKGRTAVFENGILKTFLYNCYTSRKDKRLSTGNASRMSYKSPPQTGVSNFYMEPGKKSREELLKKINKGFYVTDIIGLHSGTNPISGTISVGAKGMWIEKGDPAFPVKEVTIATDILSFCKNISDAGSDLMFLPSGGYIGSPSIIISDITISGS